MTISTEDRSKMRAALLEKGVKTRNLKGEDLVHAYRQHCESQGTTEATQTTTQTEEAVTTMIEQNTQQNAPDAAAMAQQLTQMLMAMQGQQKAPQIDEAQLIKLIEKHATKTVEIKKAGTRDIVKIEGAHPIFEEVVTWLSTGTNVYLVGPAGSGKTTMAIQAAKALSLPFYSTGAIQSAYELLGFRDAHGVYHPTPLYRAYTEGGVYLFDEMDSSSAKALNTFNQLIENDVYTFPNGPVEKHPDFVVMGGANTVGNGATRQYIGRNPLDGATKNRFVMIEVNYDQKLEQRMAKAEFERFGGTDTAALDSWVSKVQAARKKLADIGSQAIVSPRQSMFGARGIAAGLPVEKVYAANILNALSADQRKQLENV